ncbi:septal ring lytic transglycosylase RlpA family protein [Campylobacter geochelonis]|uniref:septal ring lytic transglycosylase RlpA family protein n=1 Tax=Campylobacter geochelonis TaxID=1780362 RepID=UPI000770915D|nr:septal ring lytic transglycosylase RlpA family protein [Campylobacter geochelonis]CZE49237.1 rare lipoprotein A rlpa [Campylobacter geochelonis]CZE51297.1 rare lipoprotein A rlpa [Campylobacter geochelonis]
MLYHKNGLFIAILAIFFIYGCSSKAPISQPSYKSKTPATMRPYSVNGKTYYPTMVEVGDTQKGLASWYGPNFHGKKTSNGETYNMHAQTAAHKTYPMNTMVKVTNLHNGESAVVRINDRGPFVSGRVIDLSKKVASDLGVLAKGTAPVRLEVVGFGGKEISKTAPKNQRVFEGGNFMVQVGSFRRYEGARVYKSQYHGTAGYSTIIKEFQLDGSPIYRVFLTGFRSEDEARDFAKSGHIDGAFIVRE